jgi:hypothetical protein
MKPYSAKLFGYLNRRYSDPVTPRVKVCVDEGRVESSNPLPSKHSWFSITLLPNETTSNCRTVSTLVPTEQALVTINPRLNTVARSIICCKKWVFLALAPMAGWRFGTAHPMLFAGGYVFIGSSFSFAEPEHLRKPEQSILDCLRNIRQSSRIDVKQE